MGLLMLSTDKPDTWDKLDALPDKVRLRALIEDLAEWCAEGDRIVMFVRPEDDRFSLTYHNTERAVWTVKACSRTVLSQIVDTSILVQEIEDMVAVFKQGWEFND